MIDEEICYRAALSKDARFDGAFFVAVTSTHIYCRPSCPARTPLRKNMIFVPTAASAHALGFRACKRCRPDASPGSAEWNARGDLVGRAIRLINDGFLERGGGVPGLANRLGYSERQLRRHLQAEIGTGPLALGRARRAETARILLESTSLRIGDIAFASGFSSIRQFNETCQDLYAVAPTALRKRAREQSPSFANATVSLRLSYRTPFSSVTLFGYLARRAVAGLEEATESSYRRVLDLPHAPAIATLSSSQKNYIDCVLELGDLRDLSVAVARCRALLDLDADPVAIDEVLARDALLSTSVARVPGLRVPGHVDANELAVRALLGQQVSVIGARTLTARLVAKYGEELKDPSGALTHVFPRAAVLAEIDPADLAMPLARKRAFFSLTGALASGAIVLDGGSDRALAREQLCALVGIGPWTAEYIAMRALHDPDAFLSSDLGVIHAFDDAGLPSGKAAIEAHAAHWRPWRAYGLQHLWARSSQHVSDESGPDNARTALPSKGQP